MRDTSIHSNLYQAPTTTIYFLNGLVHSHILIFFLTFLHYSSPQPQALCHPANVNFINSLCWTPTAVDEAVEENMLDEKKMIAERHNTQWSVAAKVAHPNQNVASPVSSTICANISQTSPWEIRSVLILSSYSKKSLFKAKGSRAPVGAWPLLAYY